MKTFHLISTTRLLSCFAVAVLILGLYAMPSPGQDLSNGQKSEGTANTSGNENAPLQESANAESSSEIPAPLAVSPGTFPDADKNHLFGRVFVGAARDNGILNGLFPSGASSNTTYADLGASIASDLHSGHSDYVLDYLASARYYNQYPQLDVLTQDFGLKQVVEFGPEPNGC